MKTKTQIFLFVLTVLVVVSCKKGEGDPAFSLRTRKNRVAGDWGLKSGRSSYEATNSNGSISHSEGFTYTETGYNYTTGFGVGSQTYIGSHSYNMKFNKDGTIVFTEIYDGSATTYKGKWNFNAGIGEAKAKEEINVRFESVQNSNGTKTYKGDQTSLTFTILELRNKKMRLHTEYTVKNPDGTGSSYMDSYEMVQ